MTSNVRKLIDALPQRPQIRDEDIDRWIEIVSRDPEHDVVWHVRRLSGFGGSEIGTLTLNYQGERGTFGSAEKIVQQKLMQIPPLKPDYVMRRGTLMEPVIAEVFRRDYGATRQQHILDRLAEHYSQGGANPAHPWERVYPDDVVEIAGRYYVIDYKCPTEAPTDGRTSYEYACQTHQGFGAIRHCFGQAPDGMIVVNWDHSKGTVIPIEVPWSDVIYQEMMEAGDYYWNMVVNGVVPEPIRQEEIETPTYPNATLSAIQECEKEIAILGLLKDQVSKRHQKSIEKLTQLMTQGDLYPVDVMKNLPLLSTTVRKRLDEERVAIIAAENGRDLSELKSETGRLDAEGMAKKLMSLGESPIYQEALDREKVEALCAECSVDMPFKVSASISFKANKKKNVTKKDIETLGSDVGRVMEDCLSQLRGDESKQDVFPNEEVLVADDSTVESARESRRVASP